MLLEKFKKFVEEKYPEFRFRPQQREAIEAAIEYYEKHPNGVFFLDAPTGSGKSIIAVVFSDFMTHVKKSGYILASDVSLHTQYVEDFSRLGLIHFANVKGVDNYTCSVNEEKFSIGDCKNKSLTNQEASRLECYGSCGYFSSRERCIKSPASLLTYSYALIQRNYVEDKMGDDAPFKQRDFVVCDEAHKAVDIVQSHFSPRISYETHKKYLKLLEELSALKQERPKTDPDKLKEVIDYLHESDNNHSIFKSLKELEWQLMGIVSITDKIKSKTKSKYQNSVVPKTYRSIFRILDHFKDVHCKVQDYVAIAEVAGVSKIVKNPQDRSITFNYVDDYYMMQKYFFDKFGFCLMMTATMGKAEDFAESLGIKKYGYYKMESHFKWDKSPIICEPNRRMSYKHLNNNFSWLASSVSEIVRSHKGESGIIHTASYDLTNRIWQVMPKELKSRVTVYKDTLEKEEGLKKMMLTEGQIIMGPSLLEGLNLDGDKSRFQIFLKVPYPSLSDKYVERKMKHSQRWYDYKTVVSVMQGVGRSVRSEDDWAVTYFLDACFIDLVTKCWDHFPKYFLERISLKS